MRFSFLLLEAVTVALANARSISRCGHQFTGYLLSTFSDQNPQVFWYLSEADSPTDFKLLNNGEPVMESFVGTKGARDMYLVTNTERSEYIIIATDLEINQPGFSWDEAQRNGSKGIIVWKSSDMVNWTDGELQIVESETAGMVWAPSAVWDEKSAHYYVFWSSRHYSESDPDHTGTMGVAKIRYSSTRDFVSFSDPEDYIVFPNTSVIDQEFQYLGKPDHYTRFIKNEDIKKVYQETTAGGLFGSWEREPGWVVDRAPFEGATSFADINNPELYHLLLDNYREFEHFTTTDITSPKWTLSDNNGLPPGLKHGSVFPLTSKEYEAVSQVNTAVQ